MYKVPKRVIVLGAVEVEFDEGNVPASKRLGRGREVAGVVSESVGVDRERLCLCLRPR
jgi:hypothetical protein